MVWVAAGPQSASGDTLTLHLLSCAVAAPWQQQQSWVVCPWLCRTCMRSAQRSGRVGGLVWGGMGGVDLVQFPATAERLSYGAACACYLVGFVLSLHYLHCMFEPG